MNLTTHQRTVLRRCPPDRAFKAREVGCGEDSALDVFVRTGLARREEATEVRGGPRLRFQYRLTEAGRDRQGLGPCAERAASPRSTPQREVPA